MFNSFITISYIIYAYFKSINWLDYIILINLRVFSITFLTFLFINKVNIFKAVSFSKTLSYILVLSYSQILTFKKYLNDFKFALKSRSIEKPKLRDSYNFISSIFFFFLNKSLNNSKEIAQAMKSRGFFND
jgi:cobalt/nickel transport system permease protein